MTFMVVWVASIQSVEVLPTQPWLGVFAVLTCQFKVELWGLYLICSSWLALHIAQAIWWLFLRFLLPFKNQLVVTLQFSAAWLSLRFLKRSRRRTKLFLSRSFEKVCLCRHIPDNVNRSVLLNCHRPWWSSCFAHHTCTPCHNPLLWLHELTVRIGCVFHIGSLLSFNCCRW